MVYLATVVLYGSIIYILLGMYAQLFLGAIQLIIALILVFLRNRFTLAVKDHLKRYWLYVLINITLIATFVHTGLIENDFIQTAILFVFPMLIATYFVFITYLINKQRKNSFF